MLPLPCPALHPKPLLERKYPAKPTKLRSTHLTKGPFKQQGKSATVPSLLAMTAAENRRSNLYHLRGSISGSSSRKCRRDENEDSETEVERSILCDITPESSRKRCLNGAARSENTSRCKSKAQAANRKAGDQKFTQKLKPGEMAKDRRPKREHALFL